MKKSAITLLLTITVGFAAFVGGFYSGRNMEQSDIFISGLSATVPTSTLESAVNTTPTKEPFHTLQPTAPATTVPTTTIPAGPLMVNINTATVEELDLLPGIGPVIAQAIIDYRDEYGNFDTPEDLLNVNGIGEKRLEAILDFITTGG